MFAAKHVVCDIAENDHVMRVGIRQRCHVRAGVVIRQIPIDGAVVDMHRKRGISACRYVGSRYVNMRLKVNVTLPR